MARNDSVAACWGWAAKSESGEAAWWLEHPRGAGPDSRGHQFGLANPDLFVLLSAPGRRSGSPATGAGIKVLEARVTRLAAAGLLALPEARAVSLIHAAGTGALFALLQQGAESRELSVASTMLDAVLGAVLTATPTPRRPRRRRPTRWPSATPSAGQSRTWPR